MPLDPITELLERVDRLERAAQRPWIELRGEDERRVRLGLQDDGTWGIRAWDGVGTVLVDHTSNL